MPLPGLGGLGAVSQLAIVLSLKDKASAKLKTFNRNMEGSTKRMIKMGAMVGAAVAIGIGAKALKSASDFEKAMTNVATLVDTNVESMKDMGKAVMALGKRIPVDIGELTTALYDVRSAGIGASDAMDVLESSAMLAVAGLGTTQEATNLLTSSINVFEKQGYDADQMANILFKTVKAGKTTVAELAMSFGMVAPIAGELNVALPELQAATAALTTTGMKASVAQSQLRAAMSNLMKPTKEMRELMDAVGVSTAEQLIETYGLVGGLEKLRDASQGNAEMFAKAMGSIEGLNAALFLTGEGSEAFTEIVGDMETGTEALTEAVDKQSATMAAQHQILKNKLNIVMIELGNKIMPVLIVVAEKLTWWIGKMGEGWEGLVAIVGMVQSRFDLMKLEIERVTQKIKAFIDMVKGIPSGISERISGVGERIRGLVPFQHGGIVPGPVGAPVPAIVHGGERIIPAGRGGGNIHITVTGNTFMSDEEAAEKLLDRVIDILKTQMRITI
jgi:TP901 family phage tail tape measure protein